MVRKSVLVYDLLRTEQPEEGFSEKEIVEQISNRHDIVPGKGLRRQVAVALRRGMDFGILAKKNNRFRFDINGAQNAATRRVRSTKRPRNTKKSSKKTTKKKEELNSKRNTNRKNSRSVPQPRVPKSWSPSRRNLAEEPVSKVKKV